MNIHNAFTFLLHLIHIATNAQLMPQKN